MINQISIVGLGLMGGSLAKSIRLHFPEIKIIAMDSNQESLDVAIKEHTIDTGYIEINENIANSDILFLCTPINQTARLLTKISENIHKHIIITDVCSTKSEILEINAKINKGRYTFIPGHPMTGSEKYGIAAASNNLYENAYYILCTENKDKDYNKLKTIIEGIKAIPITITPDKHDKYLSYISHFPHLVSACLVNLAKNNETKDNILRTLAAGGFKDITRISSSSPKLWESIIASNRENIVKNIDELTDMLQHLKKIISHNDKEELTGFFNSSKEYRDSFLDSPKGLVEKHSEISIDVPDQPGIIAHVSHMLKQSNINVKNIYIASSREEDAGALRLIFSDQSEAKTALDILSPVYSAKLLL